LAHDLLSKNAKNLLKTRYELGIIAKRAAPAQQGAAALNINQGRYTSSSTDVAGDLLGVPIASAYGSVGTGHDRSITITKNH